MKSGLLRIWDFSGQIMEVFEGGGAMIPNDCLTQAGEEVLVEIQVYGLPDFSKNMEMRKGENLIGKRPRSQVSFDSCLSKMNGTIEHECPFSFQSYSRGNNEGVLLGLTGLINLGNTCFMNSAIQCLAHTPKLVDYFLGEYKKEINYENPLGMNGELALAFGDLLRKLWKPGRIPVAPRLFKSILDGFAPQFSGYNQHDSQELLAFLLDGLHEDLNRVKCKPYMEVRDADGRPVDHVADEYWQNHLARNDSIIVDLCHGQYRSKLVCPFCKRVSITFDPFMYLSLPLPSTTMRAMTVTVLGANGSIIPSSVTVTVPKCGRCKDLIQALSVACSLGDDETLLVAEVYNHGIIRFLEDPSDSLALIRDDDRLAAYRLPKESEGCQLVVFMHERIERYSVYGLARPSWRLFGIPLVTRIPDLVDGSQIHNEYVQLLRPFLKDESSYGDDGEADNEFPKMDDTSTSSSDDSLNSDDEVGTCSRFRIHFSDDRGIMKHGRIKLTERLHVPVAPKKLNVLVSWSRQMMRQYDTSRLSSLPEIFRPGFPASRSQESVSLYRCLEGFLKEEPLGPEDMWYCPNCKEHRQASKKLDLWRLPEILVVHLKRFSYSRFLKNKLETYVDFPVEKLDLSDFLAHKNGSVSSCYRLYAISNHYGVMGGGHYTAMVHHGNRWFEFNDSIVDLVGEDHIKTSAAYVLFYRRTPDADA